MNGVVVIDKPPGLTSHDVVNRVRRILGQRSVGHLGTLDPSATGVLPIVLGNLTRLAQFYAHSEKTYEGAIRFGFSTDTYDADGEPTTPLQEVHLNGDEVRALAAQFRGAIEQMPPPFSAKKIADTLTSNGRPTGHATVDTYLAALTDAYLFYKVNRYDIKGKMHLKSESKYYICDTGLRNMILGTTNKDIGHQIENIVYLELVRRGYTVNIGKSACGTEVDFVAVRDRKTEYYQVSASVLDENTLQRELAPFQYIRDNYPKFLITLDDFTGDHNGIPQVNLIDWLSKI